MIVNIDHRELQDGDRFTVDGERWYICAVPLFGSVAVYVDPSNRDPDALNTVRIDVPDDGLVQMDVSLRFCSVEHELAYDIDGGTDGRDDVTGLSLASIGCCSYCAVRIDNGQ